MQPPRVQNSDHKNEGKILRAIVIWRVQYYSAHGLPWQNAFWFLFRFRRWIRGIHEHTCSDINIAECLAAQHEKKKQIKRISTSSQTQQNWWTHCGRWTQRKKGDIKSKDFSWWKLINKPDVADLKSRNGKVCFCTLFMCLLSLIPALMFLLWFNLFSFAFLSWFVISFPVLCCFTSIYYYLHYSAAVALLLLATLLMILYYLLLPCCCYSAAATLLLLLLYCSYSVATSILLSLPMPLCCH